MRKLRILVAGFLPPYPGGAATVHQVVLKYLAAQGHSIRAIAPMNGADSAAGDWFAAANPSLHIQRFEVPFYMSATAPQPELKAQRAAFASRICAECALERPDVLLLGDAVTRFDEAAPQPDGIPIAMFVHGTALHKLQNHLLSDEEMADLLDFYHGVDHLIAVAPHQSAALNSLGLTRHSVISNVIDTQEFKPRQKSASLLAELGIAADDVVVAHFSNLKPVKRPLDFVDAASIALTRNPSLSFVGGGDGEMRNAMHARCAQLGITGRFRFPGWIRSDRMPDYYSICDAVAMTSESEGRSMVFLETQASGRLLIAADIPPSRELIQDGVNGLLFPLGSPEALAERILTAAAEPAMREKVGRQARSDVEKHSLAAYGASLERTLFELAEKGLHRTA